MKPFAFALTLAFSLSLGLAACGDPSCEETARHALKVLSKGGVGYGGKMSDRDLQQGIQTCKDDKWSADMRNCIVGANDLMAMQACRRFEKK